MSDTDSYSYDPTPTDQESETPPVVHVLFDLDNTLYRYDTSGFNDEMQQRIRGYFQHNLHLGSEEEAKRVSLDYYKKYGTSHTGLVREDHDKIPRQQVIDYVHYVNDSCNYGNLKPNEELRKILLAFENANFDLWIFTNGDRQHAVECVRAMNIAEAFTDRTHDSQGNRIPPADPSLHAKKGEPMPSLKCIDIFDQWGDDAPDDVRNKPDPKAYRRAVDIIEQNVLSESMKAIKPPSPNTKHLYVFVDDTYSNLEAPAKMGWTTVFLTQGGKAPENPSFKPKFIIDDVVEMKELLAPLVDRALHGSPQSNSTDSIATM